MLVFRVDGAIFFANASAVRHAATAAVERAGRPIKLVVFTLEGASAIDLAAVAMLEDLADRLERDGISLRVAHARYPVRTVDPGGDGGRPVRRARTDAHHRHRDRRVAGGAGRGREVVRPPRGSPAARGRRRWLRCRFPLCT